MADERDDEKQQTDGPMSQSSSSPQGGFDREAQQPAGARDQSGGMSGQPIGGNDSNTGSGTTLTSGYTPPSGGYEQRLASDGTGAVAANQGRDSATHTNREGGAAGSGTTASDDSFGQGTTSNAGGSNVGTSQTSGGSSGVSGGAGFIGSQGSGSDDYVQDRASSGNATGGSDFAEQGRGALDDEDDESGSGGAGS